MKLVVALSGQGLKLGIRLLEVLNSLGVKNHLILDEYDDKSWWLEVDRSKGEVESLASFAEDNKNLTAPIASGSYSVDGMVIVPCSLERIKSLAQGYSKDLIGRAADVNLKEGRTLVLTPCESPLKTEDLQNIIMLVEAGAKIVPAIPAFYDSVTSVDRILDQIVGRILDRFNIKHGLYKSWGKYNRR